MVLLVMRLVVVVMVVGHPELGASTSVQHSSSSLGRSSGRSLPLEGYMQPVYLA